MNRVLHIRHVIAESDQHVPDMDTCLTFSSEAELQKHLAFVHIIFGGKDGEWVHVARNGDNSVTATISIPGPDWIQHQPSQGGRKQ